MTGMESLVGSVLPIGYIPEGGYLGIPSPESRMIICDGARLDTVAYPKLFSVIGTTYGGPAWRRRIPRRIRRALERHPLTRPRWFRLPDLRSRAIVAYDTPQRRLGIESPFMAVNYVIYHGEEP